MPHTSRKKRPRGPQKRRAITDDSGWTHITKGTTLQVVRGPSLPGASIEYEFQSPPAGSNIDKVRVTFDRYLDTWRSSDCFRNLRGILERSVLTSRAVKIERCVCLGLGSFTGGMTIDVSLWELAALVSVLEIISTVFDIKEVYLQDPVFNRLDEEFLQSLGYTVLCTPEALSTLTSSTFLFAPHLEWPVYIQALERATPSLCIGNTVSEYLDNALRQSTDSGRQEDDLTLQRFLDAAESLDMPHFDRALWYTSTSIYWRREKDGDDDPIDEIAEGLKEIELNKESAGP